MRLMCLLCSLFPLLCFSVTYCSRPEFVWLLCIVMICFIVRVVPVFVFVVAYCDNFFDRLFTWREARELVVLLDEQPSPTHP